MLNKLSITAFKSIENADIILNKLNLFSGANSSGKTSAIQALLLGVDNLSEKGGSKMMNTIHLPALSFNETRNYIVNAKEYSISFSESDFNVSLFFKAADDSYVKTIVEQIGEPSESLLAKLTTNVLYLSAMRNADFNNSKINPRSENQLGLRGEYVIDFYQNHRQDLLPEPLIYYRGSKTLAGQVDYWLEKLTGYKLSVETDGSEYKVRYLTDQGKSLYPYNVGTGVSFITEVLIVCLASSIGGLVVIENPEIHLHPSAQADMLDFFTQVANAGVQIVLESHSDHFFNGIRRNIHNGKLSCKDVSVYNFVKGGDGITKACEIKLNPRGGLVNYTSGMFDQFDKDLDEMLR
ncbi:MAG: AAA family ATPase [Alphaproteobacteria bacterium]|nr:AAA family ATPase [Alphaproteobacteria bacterium]